MTKHTNIAVTEAAREAGRVSVFHALEVAARKIVDRHRTEEQHGTFVGVHVVDGRITDVIATNGAVRIEE